MEGTALAEALLVEVPVTLVDPVTVREAREEALLLAQMVREAVAVIVREMTAVREMGAVRVRTAESVREVLTEREAEVLPEVLREAWPERETLTETEMRAVTEGEPEMVGQALEVRVSPMLREPVEDTEGDLETLAQ